MHGHYDIIASGDRRRRCADLCRAGVLAPPADEGRRVASEHRACVFDDRCVARYRRRAGRVAQLLRAQVVADAPAGGKPSGHKRNGVRYRDCNNCYNGNL